jgi:hypothetical protein
VTQYVITYDLRKLPGHDYQPLYDKLNSWGAAHLQDSVWLADLNGTASVVRDAIMAHLHSDDTVCVIALPPSPNWATQKARKEGIDWLRQHSP